MEDRPCPGSHFLVIHWRIGAARRTIQPLLPTADAKLHAAAVEMMQQINGL